MSVAFSAAGPAASWAGEAVYNPNGINNAVVEARRVCGPQLGQATNQLVYLPAYDARRVPMNRELGLARGAMDRGETSACLAHVNAALAIHGGAVPPPADVYSEQSPAVVAVRTCGPQIDRAAARANTLPPGDYRRVTMSSELRTANLEANQGRLDACLAHVNAALSVYGQAAPYAGAYPAPGYPYVAPPPATADDVARAQVQQAAGGLLQQLIKQH